MKLPSIEQATPLLLFVLVSSLYFTTVTGITASNDGSQYAATRALADYSSFDIAPYLSFTEELDYAIDRRGVVHSDRPPGTGMLASVVVRLGRLAPEPFVQVPSKHDGDNPRVVYAVLAAVLAGSATVVLFYAVLRDHFGVSPPAATLAALTLAFGTATWKYGTVLYAHALTSLSLFAVLYLILRAERRGAFRWQEAIGVGLALGASVLFEYTNAVLVAVTLVYLAVTWGGTLAREFRQPESRGPWLRTLAALGIGGLLPLAFFVGYNVALFGGPFRLSAYFVDPVRWACCLTLAGNFQFPILKGMQGFLFYGNENQGLFLLSPVSVFALAGWPALFRHSRRNFGLVIGTFVVFLALFSMGSTVNPGSNDGRYMVPFLGLWLIPFGVWLERTYFRVNGRMRQAALSLALFGLLFLSVRNMAAHIALSWGYDLNLAALENRSIPPHNVALVGRTLFPNAANLPLLWLLEAAGMALVAGYVAARRTLRPPLRTALAVAVLVLGAGFALAPFADSLRQPSPPGMVPLEQPFGDDLRLLGIQLSAWEAQPEVGDPVRVRLYWQLDRPLDNVPEVRLALLDADGETWSETVMPLGEATFRQIPVSTLPGGQVIQEEYRLAFESPPPFGLETDVTLTVMGETATLLPIRPATMTLGGPPQHALAYDFEGLARLGGYDVETLPNHRLAVRLHWQVAGTADTPYVVFVHVVGPDGSIAAQSDGPPFQGLYPATAWQPGESLVDGHVIQLGRAFRSGTYTLRGGLYNPESGARLPVRDAQGQPVFDDVALLGELSIP